MSIDCLLKSKVGDKITIAIHGRNKTEMVIDYAWMECINNWPAAKYPVSVFGIIHPYYNKVISIKKFKNV